MYIVIGKANCKHCDISVKQLKDEDIEYEYIDAALERNERLVVDLMTLVKASTFPVIFKYVGGSESLPDQLSNDGYL